MDNRPIGIFDSGLGGLTAVREVMRILPEEQIIYFGDTGRVPYGTRSRETIVKYAKQDINFLKTFDIKLIIVACGTVSTVALDQIKDDYDMPVIGVVESAVRKATDIAAAQNKKIAVIGTPGTIASGSYEKAIRQTLDGAQVISAACPLLVPLVENGRFSKEDRAMRIILDEYLTDISAFSPDALIMGCTHYPLLREAIQDTLGGVELVDPGAETARTVKALLEQKNMLGQTGGASYYVSDSIQNFEKYAGMFLARKVEGQVERIDIEGY